MQRKNKKRTKPKGLGDTVEKVTEATGIKKVIHWIAGEDCGCEERKEKLNKLFPYRQPKCLTEDEHQFITGLKDVVILNMEQQVKLVQTYNRIFDARKKTTRCTPCVKSMIQELQKIADQYEAGETP